MKNLILSRIKRLARVVRTRYRALQMAQLYSKGLPASPNHDNLLIWETGGMSLLLHIEGAIGIALRLRGHKVHVVVCDGTYRACMLREITDGVPLAQWKEACGPCKSLMTELLETFNLPYSYIGDYVTDKIKADLWEKAKTVSWENLDRLSYGDINVGANARSSVIRYLQGLSAPNYDDLVREYAYTGLICAAAASQALDELAPSGVFISHGVYADWGPAMQTAFARNIPVTMWMASYLRHRFYWRNIDNSLWVDPHKLSRTVWEKRKEAVLSPAQDARLDKFLEDRYQKHLSFDIKRPKSYTGETERLRQKYVPQSDIPVWGIMSHINWDIVSDFSPMAHPSFNEWILDTMREIVNILEVRWLIKIHPSEASYNPAYGAEALIRQHFPSLPDHICVIPPREEINPMDFFKLIDGCVTVYGTSGLESALLGKPIILAGEAHYGGKGFTYDGLSPETYKQLLRQAGSLPPLSEEQRQLARRYAYCYFIQRQVPLPVVRDPKSSWWGFQFDQRDLLLPGKDPFLDFICDRVLDGQDFIMDEKLVALAETWSAKA